MSQEGKPDFYTQKGYQMRSQHALTGAMEDYLEMICRQAEADGCARIGLLAEGLNVRPSSASKMVYQLRALGLVAFEKYGLIPGTRVTCTAVSPAGDPAANLIRGAVIALRGRDAGGVYLGDALWD